MFSIFSNWVKHIFHCQSFHWRNEVCRHYGLWRVGSSSRPRDVMLSKSRPELEGMRIRRRKGGNLLGKSENPAETCLIFTVLWNILHCRCASWPIPASMTTSISWNMAALRLCSSPCRTQQTQEMAGMIFEDPWISGFFVPSLKTDIF